MEKNNIKFTPNYSIMDNAYTFDFAVPEIKLGVMVLDASDFYVDSSRLRQEMQILSVTKNPNFSFKNHFVLRIKTFF